MQLHIESTYLPRVAAPPGLDSNLMDTAAKSVAQVHGSDFVDRSVLWAPSNQHMLLPEVALFATDNAQQLDIDSGNNLSVRTSDSHLASWIPPLQSSLNLPAYFKDTRLDIE